MAFIRQDLDPDSLPSRRKRRMFKRKARTEVSPVEYPNRRALYDIDTLEGKVFNTIEEIDEALASGKWITHPKMSLKDWLEYREKCEEDGEEEEEVNWVERLKLRDSNKSIVPSARKKYLIHMNVEELIKAGRDVGIDFGNSNTCPTRAKMIGAIKRAKQGKK